MTIANQPVFDFSGFNLNADNLRIKLDQFGSIDSTKARLAICSRVQHKPTISRIVGCVSDADTGKLSYALEPLACGEVYESTGEGNAIFELCPGAYTYTALDWSYRILTDYFFVTEKHVFRCEAWDWSRVLRKAFGLEASAEFDKPQLCVKYILDAVKADRETYESLVIDGMSVSADFAELCAEPEILRRLNDRDEDEGYRVITREVVRLISGVRYWKITKPVFAGNKSLELALAAAKTLVGTRAMDLVEAKTKADDSGLPQLLGSPKQVAWALTIRAQAQAKDPKNSALKRAKNAKYWIDNRTSF